MDFARWQRERLQGEALKQELAFWRERLEGAPAILELPTDHPRRHMATPRGDAVTFEVLDPTAARFKALAQMEGATLFMALLALFDVLLFRYAGQGDFVVGVPVANRNRTELESVVGCFASTLLVRAGVRARDELPRASWPRCETRPWPSSPTPTCPSRSWSRSCSRTATCRTTPCSRWSSPSRTRAAAAGSPCRGWPCPTCPWSAGWPRST